MRKNAMSSRPILALLLGSLLLIACCIAGSRSAAAFGMGGFGHMGGFGGRPMPGGGPMMAPRPGGGLILAAGTGSDGPGPLVTSIVRTAGDYMVPVAIVPGHLTDDELDALS